MPPRRKHHRRHKNFNGNRLTDVPSGTKYEILSVGTNYGSKRRLAHLGLLPGVKIVKKRSAPMRGPIEVEVKGTNLVIGRGLARHIIVETND
ncbi:MAG: ferrous iron transport protein A [Promethearchaeota archaeon]|nr:MAG: ferrous iron transport protein A [Candidatus Lokiarchaeota archaeon]